MTATSHSSRRKIKIQWYIFIGGVLLFLCKIAAFFITNSVGILSDTLESTVNVVTGLITLKSLQWASKPQDEDHPYGHGKIELITASFEGVLIGIAGALIIIEAIKRISSPPLVVKIDVGIALLGATALVNYIMGRFSITEGTKNNSISLISGGRHLISDTYTTIALILGLVLYNATGFQWMDSLLAVILGFIVIYTSYTLLKDTINGLLDEADGQAISILSEQFINNRNQSWVNIHKLTYLKFGHISHVDLHLTLPWYYNVRQTTHEVSQLKTIIRKFLPEEIVDISIQSEACQNDMCRHCGMECDYRADEFIRFSQWNRDKITGKNKFKFQ
ncbi:MAG: cation transporter [Saprospiraceae bacterium]|nr:cation transporter [Saprospiraceae bacterium]